MSAYWSGGGWDAAGNLKSYTVENFKASNGRFKYTTTHTFNYRRSDSYQQIGESTVSWGNNAPNQGSTTRTYNVNNELIQFSDKFDKTTNRYFANNAQGQALTVVQGKFDGRDGRMTPTRAFDNALTRTGNQVKAQYYYFSQGENIGTFGQLTDEEGDPEANFDVNYTPVSAQYPASVPGQVVAQTGDTLRSIARRVYGDSNLWYLIAEENGLSEPDAELEAGTTLTLPNRVLSIANDAQGFKPFDYISVLGDTTPTPRQSSSGWVQIFGTAAGIVVGGIVSYYSGDSTLGGLAGAAAANHATQFATLVDQGLYDWDALGRGLVTNALVGGAVGGGLVDPLTGYGLFRGVGGGGSGIGLVDLLAYGAPGQRFDYESVAISAAAGAASGYFGGAIGGAVAQGTDSVLAGQLSGAAAGAVAGYGTTVALNRLAGNQIHWNWREVATSALASMAAAGASYGAGRAMGLKLDEANFGTRAAAGAGSVAVRLLRGGKLNAVEIALDVFGNPIANSLLVKSAPPPQVAATEQAMSTYPSLEEMQAHVASMGSVLDRNPEWTAFEECLTPTPDEIRSHRDIRWAGMRSCHSKYVVQRGDSYARIARNTYGDERFESAIMAANGVSPTYGEVHGLRVGSSLNLPNLGGASQGVLDTILEDGGAIISADRAITREINDYNRFVDWATNHPDTFSGTVARAHLSGKSWDDIVGERYVASLPPAELMSAATAGDMMAAAIGLPNVPRIAEGLAPVVAAAERAGEIVRTLQCRSGSPWVRRSTWSNSRRLLRSTICSAVTPTSCRPSVECLTSLQVVKHGAKACHTARSLQSALAAMTLRPEE